MQLLALGRPAYWTTSAAAASASSMVRIVARSTQLVTLRIARREQPSATRTRRTPRSKSSVANELDVDVVNSGRSATLRTRSSKALLSIRSLRQSFYWVRYKLFITIRLTDFDSCLFFFLGMGGGLHKSFNVKGSRTPASAWLNACRLARRGFIVILVDEFNSSKVTRICLQIHTSIQCNNSHFFSKMCPCCAQELIHRQVWALCLCICSQFIARPILRCFGVVLVSVDRFAKQRHAKSTMSIVTSLRRRSRYRASFWRMLSSRHDRSSTAHHRNRLLLFVFWLFRMHERSLDEHSRWQIRQSAVSRRAERWACQSTFQSCCNVRFVSSSAQKSSKSAASCKGFCCCLFVGVLTLYCLTTLSVIEDGGAKENN